MSVFAGGVVTSRRMFAGAGAVMITTGGLMPRFMSGGGVRGGGVRGGGVRAVMRGLGTRRVGACGSRASSRRTSGVLSGLRGGWTGWGAMVNGRIQIGLRRVNGPCRHRPAEHGGHRENKNRDARRPRCHQIGCGLFFSFHNCLLSVKGDPGRARLVREAVFRIFQMPANNSG
jgi:hypothetical protein